MKITSFAVASVLGLSAMAANADDSSRTQSYYVAGGIGSYSPDSSFDSGGMLNFSIGNTVREQGSNLSHGMKLSAGLPLTSSEFGPIEHEATFVSFSYGLDYYFGGSAFYAGIGIGFSYADSEVSNGTDKTSDTTIGAAGNIRIGYDLSNEWGLRLKSEGFADDLAIDDSSAVVSMEAVYRF